jgi:hypothetical protein
MKKPPYGFIADALKAGDVIPFFGAAASAVYRPEGETWTAGKPFMPFGGELAATLAKAANYTAAESIFKSAVSDLIEAVTKLRADISREEAEKALVPVLRKHIGGPPDLALIASWAEHVQGDRRAVDRMLRQSFAVDCRPGLLHEKIASIPSTQIFVTTNYDDLLEKALAPRGPHLIVDRGDKGLWVGVAGGELQQVAALDLYELLNDPMTQRPSRPIVFKMHGSIDRKEQANDCYLITEEDYVNFLGRPSGGYIPAYLDGLIRGKNFLFLGYSLEDWNVRVILHKLLTPVGPEKVRFWAVVRGRSDEEQELWDAHDVTIYSMDLNEFAEQLAVHL